MILIIIRVKLLVINLISISRENIVNEDGRNYEVGKTKIKVKTAKSKSKNLVKLFLIKSKLFAENSGSSFLIPRARLAFPELRLAFIKVSILHYFDFKSHIWIKTDISSYTINRVLSQLTLNNSSWWHLMTVFFKIIILIKTQYKINNGKFLAIVEVFKTWRHYREDFKYKVLVLMDPNNLCRFIDIKSLSFK